MQKVRKPKVGNRTGKPVHLEEDRAEPGEVVERRRDPTSETISGEVDPDEILQLEDGRRDLSGEPVSLKVEVPELRAPSDVGGEVSGERIEAEAEDAEAGEVADGGRRDGPHQAGAREAERGDAAGIAANAWPSARRLGSGPRQRAAHGRTEG